MARITSDSYYEKVCTTGVVCRGTGKTSGQVHKMVQHKLVMPAVDPYTGFYLFSPEDIDKIKFADFCHETMQFPYKSMPYLLAFLKEVMPDYSWSEMQEVLATTAKVVDSQPKVEPPSLGRYVFGRKV